MIAAQPLRKTTKTNAYVNPHGHKPARKAARPKRMARKVSGARRRTNPGATVLLGYINPPEKTMKQKRNSKKRSVQIRRGTRKNPIQAKALHRHRKTGHPRRKNPLSARSIISKPIELLKAGAIGALAFFATRQLPQAILKSRNVSWVGYLANAITAIASAAAADRYFGPTAGTAAFVGGGMALFSRVLNDQTDLGKRLNLSGVGDPVAHAGMGEIVPGYWAQPPVVARSGAPVIPQAVVDAVKAQLPPPAPAAVPAAGVSGGRFGSRW